MFRLIPRQPVPPLSVPTLDNGNFDTEERAGRARTQWELHGLRPGYGMSIDTARGEA